MSRTTTLLAGSDPAGIAEAARILRTGGLVAFPTETVYGLGAAGLDPEAVAAVFEAKGRPHTDPLILHVESAAWLPRLCGPIPPEAGPLADHFWPGPLTLVLPALEAVPRLVTAGLDTVAVRSPAHPIARALLAEVDLPLAAPSANLFGHISPTTASHVLRDLDGLIDAVVDGGPCEVGLESTVLSLVGERPTILRPGAVTPHDISRLLGVEVAEDAATAGPDQAQQSPGRLHRHYSPRTRLILIEDEDDCRAHAALREAAAEGAALLLYDEDAAAPDMEPAGRFPPLRALLGSRHDPAGVARGLYAALRAMDEAGAHAIAVRLLPPGGLADAVNDRLRRAAAPDEEL